MSDDEITIRKLASDEAWQRVKSGDIHKPLSKSDIEIIVATLPSVKMLWFEAGAAFAYKLLKEKQDD